MELLRKQSDWGPIFATLVCPKEPTDIDGCAILQGEWVCLVMVYAPFISSVLGEVLRRVNQGIPSMKLIYPRSESDLGDAFGRLVEARGSTTHLVRLPLEEDEEGAVLIQSLE
jgi:hypothetical protein